MVVDDGGRGRAGVQALVGHPRSGGEGPGPWVVARLLSGVRAEDTVAHLTENRESAERRPDPASAVVRLSVTALGALAAAPVVERLFASDASGLEQLAAGGIILGLAAVGVVLALFVSSALPGAWRRVKLP
ncbi:hypothetical protein [Xylanimonas sp. McL0601]|uniref:hypothetical protein n=1 Tax=Xylanimonas sp. McL0601 TaxID=3414739 RepID=UPI003CF14C22